MSLGTNDAVRAAAFYDPLLATLGIRKLHEAGLDNGTSIMFSLENPTGGHPASVGNGVHVAFLAESRDGRRLLQNRPRPGRQRCRRASLRPEYDANYYGVFVRDPDGNKIEAVSFAAQ